MLLQRKSLDITQPTVGCLVQNLRHVLGLTQKQFAAHLGVTFPTINRWENGHAMPSPLALRQIDTLLNQLCESPEMILRERSQAIREQYFPLGRPKA